MGNPTKEVSPLGKTTTYAYDVYGRVINLVNPNQISIAYAYDKVGNIEKLTFTNGTNENNISYGYDSLYNPSSIKDSLGAAIPA